MFFYKTNKNILLVFFISLALIAAIFISKAIKPFFFKKTFKSCFVIQKNKIQKIESQQAFFKILEQCFKQGEFAKQIFIFENFFLKERANVEFKNLIQKTKKQLAQASFYKTKNYETALKYYTQLLTSSFSKKDKFSLQKHIAMSYLFLKKHKQALMEVDKMLLFTQFPQDNKQQAFLKIRILIEKKDYDQALLFLEQQIIKFPKDSKFFREHKILIYEIKKQFFLAIKELEKIEPSLSTRKKMQSLLEQQKNQPGYKN